MGQYHTIYNLTKKEYISASCFDEGIKLREFGCGGLTTQALCLLLSNSNQDAGGDFSVYGGPDFMPREELRPIIKAVAGRWAGDKIVIQGDYAKKGDRAYIGEKARDGFTNISAQCLEAVLTADDNRSEALANASSWCEGEILLIARSLDKKIKRIDAANSLKRKVERQLEKKAAGAK